jgi:ankyrin repeat protein
MVAFLLGQGAQANSRMVMDKTPLMLACQEGKSRVARILLQHMGAQALEETDANGRTALHSAASWGHEKTVALLLKEGAPVNSRMIDGATPHMLACQGGHLRVVRVLLHHMGAQALHQRDDHGKTALHWAVEKGHHEAVKLLLLAGADPTITDNEGRTPRALAEGEVERAGCVAAFEVRESRVLYPHNDCFLPVLTMDHPTRGRCFISSP